MFCSVPRKPIQTICLQICCAFQHTKRTYFSQYIYFFNFEIYDMCISLVCWEWSSRNETRSISYSISKSCIIKCSYCRLRCTSICLSFIEHLENKHYSGFQICSIDVCVFVVFVCSITKLNLAIYICEPCTNSYWFNMLYVYMWKHTNTFAVCYHSCNISFSYHHQHCTGTSSPYLSLQSLLCCVDIFNWGWLDRK